MSNSRLKIAGLVACLAAIPLSLLAAHLIACGPASVQTAHAAQPRCSGDAKAQPSQRRPDDVHVYRL